MVCHFHYCDTLTWMQVHDLLDRLLLARIRAEESSFVFTLSNDCFETIRDFVEQMDVAYLHPRKDSFQVSLLAARYSNFSIGKEKMPRKRALTAYLAKKKNLSQTKSEK